MRRLPVHLARDERRRPKPPVEGFVGQKLWEQANRKGEAAGESYPYAVLKTTDLSALFSARGIGPAPAAPALRLRAAPGAGAADTALGLYPASARHGQIALAARSTAGPNARNTSCSRTIAISARGQPERDGAADAPAFADLQPDRHEQGDGKRRARVRVRRRHVHVEKQRRAQPHHDAGERSTDRQRGGPAPIDRRTARKP